MEMTVELSVWLALAGLALGAAYIVLWRTRRALSQSHDEVRVPQIRLAPAALLVPAVLSESASSAIAS